MYSVRFTVDMGFFIGEKKVHIKEALIIVNIHFVGCYVEYGKKSDIK
jgi:hypothetical protein